MTLYIPVYISLGGPTLLLGSTLCRRPNLFLGRAPRCSRAHGTNRAWAHARPVCRPFEALHPGPLCGATTAQRPPHTGRGPGPGPAHGARPGNKVGPGNTLGPPINIYIYIYTHCLLSIDMAMYICHM